MKSILLLIITAALVSCKTEETKPVDAGPRAEAPKQELVVEAPKVEIPAPVVESPKPEQFYEADWNSIKEGPAWSKMTADALETYGQNLITQSNLKDAAAWCPKFNSLSKDQKKQVYIMLISAMAKRESGFKPGSSYQESFKGSDGTYVVSRGLLQISKSSSNQSEYKCGTTNVEMLYDPKFNLTCGVKILNYFAKDQHIAGTSSNSKLGAGRYWSVGRPTSGSYKYIQGKVRAFCDKF